MCVFHDSTGAGRCELTVYSKDHKDAVTAAGPVHSGSGSPSVQLLFVEPGSGSGP